MISAAKVIDLYVHVPSYTAAAVLIGGAYILHADMHMHYNTSCIYWE